MSNSIRARDVLRRGPFVRLLAGQFVSQLGDGLIYLSLIIMLNRLLSEKEAAAAIGILLICQTAPRVLFGLLAGVYVDRLDRKRLMIIADVARGGLVLACLLVTGPETIWVYYVCAALLSTLSAVFAPAKSASLPHLVTKDQLLIANTLSQTSFYIALTTGTALSGVLIGAFNSPVPAIVFDALSFGVSAIFIASLPLPHQPVEAAPDQRAGRVWADLKEGLRFVAGQRLLVGSIMGFAVTMLGAGATNVLFVPFVVNDLGLSETWVGFIDLTQVMGMVLINLFVARIAARYSPAVIFGAGIVGLGLSIAITGWVQAAWILFPLSVLWGLTLAPVQASAATIVQNVPDAVRGRTVSATETIVGIANVASMALAGLAGSVIGARSSFIAGGFIAALGGVLAWWLMRSAAPPERAVAGELIARTVEVPVENER